MAEFESTPLPNFTVLFSAPLQLSDGREKPPEGP